MAERTAKSKSRKTINIGVYGMTAAGKTRFLYELLNDWKTAGRLLTLSNEAREFLKQVEKEIETHSKALPTVAARKDMRVGVSFDSGEPPLQLVFRDLRGELLAGEIPPNGDIQRKGEIADQVKNCDAFLFFLDPASSEAPEKIDRHHQQELERAKSFITYVLKKRQNLHLPIVFVLTHFDKWENNDDIRKKAESWEKQIHDRLKNLYRQHLRGYYPDALVSENRIFFHVSSIEKRVHPNQRLETIVEELSRMLSESERHRREPRRRVWLVVGRLVGVVIVIVLFSYVGLPWLARSVGSGSSMRGNDRAAILAMTEPEVKKMLNELDSLLDAHPPGAELPKIQEAKAINHHLQWLTVWLKKQSGETQSLSRETDERMRSAIKRIGKVILEKAESTDGALDKLIEVLTEYLRDLSDMKSISEELGDCQSRYWMLRRKHVVEQLAQIIRRRDEVASPPRDGLKEMTNTLGDIKKKVRDCTVFGDDARSKLKDEIEAVQTFCETLEKQESYTVRIAVRDALFPADERVRPVWRSIALESSDQAPGRLDLKPLLKAEGESLSYTTEDELYDLKLGLGFVACKLLRQELPSNKFVLEHDFGDLTARENRGPLAPLGFPLFRPNQRSVTIALQGAGIGLKLEFSGFSPNPPKLLSDVAEKLL